MEKKTNGIGLGTIVSYSQTDIDTPGGLIPEPWQLAFGKGIAFRENFRLSTGYAAERTFLALEFVMEAPTYTLKHMSIGTESSDLSLQFGVKF